MNYIEEFEFWCGEYRDNPRALDSETLRLLQQLCEAGNPHAINWREASANHRRTPDLVDLLGSAANGADGDLGPKEELAAYPPDWREIATTLKNERQWRCEICKFQKAGAAAIQVHHIDGDKTDNERANLQVLCAVCHGYKHDTQPLWGPVSEADQRDCLQYRRARPDPAQF